MSYVIFRVENSSRKGPYNNGGGDIFRDNKKHRNKNVRPTPQLDEELADIFVAGEMRFGFRTPTQLKKWFPLNDRIKLEEKHFHVSVYEIASYEEMYWSKTQLVTELFSFRQVKLIEEVKMCDLDSLSKYRNKLLPKVKEDKCLK